MYVSTRCNFPNFSLIWLSANDFEEYAPLKLYPKLTEKIIKYTLLFLRQIDMINSAKVDWGARNKYRRKDHGKAKCTGCGFQRSRKVDAY